MFSPSISSVFADRRGCSDSLPALMMDRSRMVQVFLNLVNNAQKHAVGAKTVRLSAALDEGGKTVSFRVKDYGIGIPPEHLVTSLSLFTRQERNGSGTGDCPENRQRSWREIQVESTPALEQHSRSFFPSMKRT